MIYQDSRPLLNRLARLNPLKLLSTGFCQALWVLTHLQQQLAQLQMKDESSVADALNVQDGAVIAIVCAMSFYIYNLIINS